MNDKITLKKSGSLFKRELSSALFALGILTLLLGAIAWPLASIWALNVLFELSIPYTFWTWLACWVLIMTFQGAINIKRERTINPTSALNR